MRLNPLVGSDVRSRGVLGSFVGVVVMSLAALVLVAASAPAADQTWNTGSGSWDTTTSNWIAPTTWTNGNTAIFGGTPGSTISIDAAGISAAGLTFNVDGNTVSASSTNTLALGSSATITTAASVTGTISAPMTGVNNMTFTKAGAGLLDLSGNNDGLLPNVDNYVANPVINGGGELRISAGTTRLAQTINLTRSMGTTTIGSTSADNKLTVSGTGKLIIPKTRIGLNSSGGNSMTVSAPGNSSSVSNYSVYMVGSGETNVGSMVIGGGSSSNSLTINNGAYFYDAVSSTSTWTVGSSAGANSNSITVTGSSGGNASTLYLGANQFLTIGAAGDSNSLTVSNGGAVRSGRLSIGNNGGASNYLSIDGDTAGVATYTLNGSTTNSWIEIGAGSTANGNYLSVKNGGVFNGTGSGTNRQFSIGGKSSSFLAQTAGGNSNYIEVIGSTSSFTLAIGMPLALGGQVLGAGPGTLTDGGNNNRIDIFSGGAMTLTNTSLYVLGSTSTGNTSVNLGNGTGVSQLTVGASTGYAAGILLNNANGRLNFNGGRLIGGSSGNLVSGPGQVVLNGAAYVQNANSNTISSLISGSGSFTKEGAGTLALTAANTYTGDTSVLAGILQLDSAFLSDNADVFLVTGSKMKLNFASAGVQDTIRSLYINGVQQEAGTYTGANLSTYIDSSSVGSLVVAVGVPEPETLTIVALGAAGIAGALGRRRRRNVGKGGSSVGGTQG